MKIIALLILAGTLSAQQITEKQALARKRWPNGQLHCNPGETTVFGVNGPYRKEGFPSVCQSSGRWYGKEFEAWRAKDEEEREAWYRKVECGRECKCSR